LIGIDEKQGGILGFISSEVHRKCVTSWNEQYFNVMAERFAVYQVQRGGIERNQA